MADEKLTEPNLSESNPDYSPANLHAILESDRVNKWRMSQGFWINATEAALDRCAELEKTCAELDGARLRVENNAVEKIEQIRRKRQNAADQRAAALERCAELEARVAELEAERDEKPTASIHYWDDEAHDGPGWYYVDDEYNEEGSCGAFTTRDECVAHAEAAGYRCKQDNHRPEPAKESDG